MKNGIKSQRVPNIITEKHKSLEPYHDVLPNLALDPHCQRQAPPVNIERMKVNNTGTEAKQGKYVPWARSRLTDPEGDANAFDVDD